MLAGSGLMGALVAVNFALVLLYLFSRHLRFITLAAFVFMLTLAYSALLDDSLTIWQIGAEKGRFHWLMFSGAALLAGLQFSAELLGFVKRHRQLNKRLKILGAALVLSLLVAMVFDIAQVVLLVIFVCLCLTLIGVGVWAWRKLKVDVAVWLNSGWSLLLVTFVYALVVLTGSPSDEPLKHHVTMLTAAVGVCACWFIAVCRQFMSEKSQMLASQHKALAQAKAQEQMQQELLRIEEEAREELEAKIQERTFELEVTLRELQDANRELEEKNTQDALTGIRNRRFFDKKYLAEFRRSRRERTELSLVMLDIDHFKKVNDNYGHLAGDEVIRFVGRTIGDMLKRPSDEGCRYGGEEFALILPSTDTEGAIKLAEMLRKTIEQTAINTESGVIKITVSCGVYTSVAEMEMNQNQYIELADKALYQAKHTGRNQVVHYNLSAAFNSVS